LPRLNIKPISDDGLFCFCGQKILAVFISWVYVRWKKQRDEPCLN